MDKIGMPVIIGVLLGTMARLVMLKSDYRQYPGYPHGHINHIAFGFIAAVLGAVAVPALVNREWTAVTFLALAAQQFREIRSMERETLAAMESTALISRGVDYIEGIARVFEARNYLVMGTAFFTGGVAEFWGLMPAVATGALLIMLSLMTMKGRVIGDIARVKQGRIYFEDTRLMVDDIDFMTVGLTNMRELIVSDGLGVVLTPKDHNARSTLHQMGQRQAIVHVAASILGTKIDVDYPELTPMVRKNIHSGEVALYLVPAVKDVDSLIEAVKRVPVLESSQRLPMHTRVGRLLNGRVKQ